MEYLWNTYGIPMEYLWNTYGIPMEYLWNSYGTTPEQHRRISRAPRQRQGPHKGFPPGAVTSRANNSMLDIRRRSRVCFRARVSAGRWGLATWGREATVHE